MASTFYDSQLTAAEIEAALEAIDGVIVPANNGKLLGVENGAIVAKPVSDYVDLNLQAKTATPGASQQVISPDSGYNGLSAVTVEGVVAPNLIAGNIKKDVVVKVGTATDDDSVMTVTGTFEGGGVPTLQAKTATENGVVTPDAGYDGLSQVTVNVPSGVLTGRDAPAASLGSDGDYYKQVIPIPNDVTFVEYLLSSGAQYIDTGIYATLETDVECDCVFQGNKFILGCRTGSADSAKKALVVTGSSSGISVYKAGTSANGTVASKAASAAAGDVLHCRTKTIKEGTSGAVLLSPKSGVARAVPVDSFTADYTQILFGIGQGSTPTKDTAQIRRVTYYQGGVPLHDYLACLDGDGVACMWDNVAGEYVYNDGTGDFTYGSELSDPPDALEPVLYVKKNGAWEVVGNG